MRNFLTLGNVYVMATVKESVTNKFVDIVAKQFVVIKNNTNSNI